MRQMSIKIYHNPRCSKSRQTLQLMTEQAVNPQVVDYLKTPPSREDLEAVLDMLGLEPRAWLRKPPPAAAAGCSPGKIFHRPHAA